MISDTEDEEYSEQEEYFEEGTMNRVNKRGNENRKKGVEDAKGGNE